jgi:RNA polymerase sigma factor for flagellar operon FliA
MHQAEVDHIWETLPMSRRDRERLILHYQPFVERVVYKLSRSYPAEVSREDLLQYGMLGLIEAIDKFDPSLGIRFETFGFTRVRGAVLDGIRKEDWVPRPVRRRIREWEDTYSALLEKNQQIPTAVEVFEDLGWEEEEYAQFQAARLQRLTPLEHSQTADNGENYGTWEPQILDQEMGQVAQSELAETKSEVVGHIGDLSLAQQMVLQMVYLYRKPFKEVAELFEISESRVSQIHGEAMDAIRGRLG